MPTTLLLAPQIFRPSYGPGHRQLRAGLHPAAAKDLCRNGRKTPTKSYLMKCPYGEDSNCTQGVDGMDHIIAPFRSTYIY